MVNDLGFLMFSTAISHEVLKGRKMGEFGLPGRTLKTPIAMAAIMMALERRLVMRDRALVVVNAVRTAATKVGMRKPMRIVTEPTGVIKMDDSVNNPGFSLPRKKPGPNLRASRMPSTAKTTPLLTKAVKKALVSLAADLLVVVATKIMARKSMVDVVPTKDSISWGRLVVNDEAIVAAVQMMIAKVNGVIVKRTERVRMFLMVHKTIINPVAVASKSFLLKSNRSEPKGLKNIGVKNTVRIEIMAIA